MLRLCKENLSANCAAALPPETLRLRWGEPEETRAALERLRLMVGAEAELWPDLVLLSDTVYGSNPGVWVRLADTLSDLCRDTLVIISETERLERVRSSRALLAPRDGRNDRDALRSPHPARGAPGPSPTDAFLSNIRHRYCLASSGTRSRGGAFTSERSLPTCWAQRPRAARSGSGSASAGVVRALLVSYIQY